MTVNEIELVLWFAVSTNTNIIFWLLMRAYKKECEELLRLTGQALKLARANAEISERWEKLHNVQNQNV